MSPLVSAIVLNYGTPKHTVRCVRALLKQTVADKLEILIVDNHSHDESIQYIQNQFHTHPSVRIIETRGNLGYGRGNDMAIKQASGTYLLIINPDNELEPKGLEKMVQQMEADPTIGLLGPKLIHEDGSVRDSARAFPRAFDVFVKRTFPGLFKKRISRYLRKGEDPNATKDVDWVVGACLLIRKDLYLQLGGFDPRFFLFFEDTDLCRRIWKAGKRVVYFPEAVATDRKQRLSSGGVLSVLTKKTMRIHLWSGLKYFGKWGWR